MCRQAVAMLTIAAAAIFIFGFAVLWNAEVPVSAGKRVTGTAAKIVGGLLMAAGPLAYLTRFICDAFPYVFVESQRDIVVPGILIGLSLIAIVFGIVSATPTTNSPS